MLHLLQDQERIVRYDGIIRDDKHFKLCSRDIYKILKKQLEEKEKLFGREWQGNESNYPNEAIFTAQDGIPPIKIKKGKSIISTIARSENNSSKVGEIDVEISHYWHLKVSIKAIVKTLWNDSTFWDLIFPYTISFCAIIVLAIKWTSEFL